MSNIAFLVHSNNILHLMKRDEAYKSMARAHLSLAVTNLVLYFLVDDSDFKKMHAVTALWSCKRIWSLQKEQLKNRKTEYPVSLKEINHSFEFMKYIELAMSLRFTHSVSTAETSSHFLYNVLGAGMYCLGFHVYENKHREFRKSFS